MQNVRWERDTESNKKFTVITPNILSTILSSSALQANWSLHRQSGGPLKMVLIQFNKLQCSVYLMESLTAIGCPIEENKKQPSCNLQENYYKGKHYQRNVLA